MEVNVVKSSKREDYALLEVIHCLPSLLQIKSFIFPFNEFVGQEFYRLF